MNLLAVETTGKYVSVALIKEDGTCFFKKSDEELKHLKEVLLLSEKCLEEAGVSKDELSCVSAGVGPGSFTGIRIGVTVARTLSQILQIPCIGISSLESLKQSSLEYAKQNGCDYICTIINARRKQTYGCIYNALLPREESKVVEDKQYMIDEIIEIIKGLDGRVLITGDGVDAYSKIIEEGLPADKYLFAREDLRHQMADASAALSLDDFNNGKTLFYEELLPNYMRLSEAEQRLKDGTLSPKIKN